LAGVLFCRWLLLLFDRGAGSAGRDGQRGSQENAAARQVAQG